MDTAQNVAELKKVFSGTFKGIARDQGIRSIKQEQDNQALSHMVGSALWNNWHNWDLSKQSFHKNYLEQGPSLLIFLIVFKRNDKRTKDKIQKKPSDYWWSEL